MRMRARKIIFGQVVLKYYWMRLETAYTHRHYVRNAQQCICIRNFKLYTAREWQGDYWSVRYKTRNRRIIKMHMPKEERSESEYLRDTFHSIVCLTPPLSVSRSSFSDHRNSQDIWFNLLLHSMWLRWDLAPMNYMYSCASGRCRLQVFPLNTAFHTFRIQPYHTCNTRSFGTSICNGTECATFRERAWWWWWWWSQESTPHTDQTHL